MVMLMKYETLILNALLDSFERSAQGKKITPSEAAEKGYQPDGGDEFSPAGAAIQGRRIWFHFNRKKLPAYFNDTSARPKTEINETCLNLEERGLIEIHWVKHEKGNLIEKVSLNIAALSEAYRCLGRKPRAEAAGDVCALARSYSTGAPDWAASFFEWVTSRLGRGESVARYLDIGDLDRVEMLFQVLCAAGELKEETPRRIFSQRVLGNSKAFDSVAGALARAARDFHPALQNSGGEGGNWEQKEVLAELGLLDNPQHLFISGPLKFSIRDRIVDVAAFTPDIGLPAEIVRQMTFLEMNADRVITIENLTSYYEFVKKHQGRFLVIYLGGYHNSPRRLFLTKLRDFLAATGRAVAFHHWGDIDYGGFTIFNHLRMKCGLDLKPMHMDEATLLRYEQYAMPFDRAYAEKLRRLLAEEDYEVFHDTIRCMLEKGIRLEQECVEVEVV